MLLGFDRFLIVATIFTFIHGKHSKRHQSSGTSRTDLSFVSQEQLMCHYGLILKGEVCHSSAPSGSKVNCSCEWWGGFDTSLIAWKSNGTPLHKSHMICGIIQIRWKYLVRGFETLFKLEKIYATSGFRNKKIINFLHYRIDL